jgi:hypothetical protein
MRAKSTMCGVIVVMAVVGGCSPGLGAPDGWMPMRGGLVTVWHPKAWTQVPVTGGALAAAVLRSEDGRQRIAELMVWRRAVSLDGKQVSIGGRPARVLRHDQGRNHGIEVTTTDSLGRPVLVQANGTGGALSAWGAQRIANSITVD